jgi:ATP-dependent Clp protease ATP-binding subunit ClpA
MFEGFSNQAGGRRHGLLGEILGHVESVDAELSAFGQRIGVAPETADLDRRIAQVRREKESAAQAEDYETAATLRDSERELRAEREALVAEWAQGHPRMSLVTEGLRQFGDEVRRLGGLLQSGGDGKGSAAKGSEAKNSAAWGSAARDDAAQADAVRDEAAQADAVRDEAAQADAARDDAAQADAVRDDAAQADVVRDDAATDDAEQVGEVKDDAATDDAA